MYGKNVYIRRKSIDNDTRKLIFAGSSYWSEHEDNGHVYYKYIARFYPIDMKSGRLPIASRVVQENLHFYTVNLVAKFEALLGELTKKDIITESEKNKLLNSSPSELLSKERLKHIDSEFDKVINAEDWL